MPKLIECGSRIEGEGQTSPSEAQVCGPFHQALPISMMESEERQVWGGRCVFSLGHVKFEMFIGKARWKCTAGS